MTEFISVAAVHLNIVANLVVVSVNTFGSLSYFLYSVVDSIVDSYLPDLVLQGVQDNNFRGSLSTDLKFTLQVSDLNNQCTVNQLMWLVSAFALSGEISQV